MDLRERERGRGSGKGRERGGEEMRNIDQLPPVRAPTRN